MKFLLLLFLLLNVSATENNKQPVASYDIKPELFWLEENKYDGVPLEESYYAAIYYEPLSDQYFFATIKKTNNVVYDTNNIKDEKQFIEYKYPKTPLTYVGSLNITNRIYIDTSRNQYIKQLEIINDSVYIDYITGKEKLLTLPIYPYVHYDTCGDTIRYSNKNHINFYRNVFAPENNETKLKATLREYRDPRYY